jgi:hypothetical protein
MISMNETTCSQAPPRRVYSPLQTVAHNLPYGMMAALGAGVFLAGLGTTPWGWGIGGLYALYCAVGAMWIMVFVCPYCQFYGTRSCPCGYGWIAARLRAKSAENSFARQFRRHIPAIVPLWFIPPVAAAVFMIRDFSVGTAGLAALFAVDAFLVLPLVSRRYGCAHCPQKGDCPWMG